MRRGRAVATFHDLFVMTGEYSTPEFRARFTAQAREAAARADAIIAVSEFTRRQVVELLQFDPARVHVVHHGLRPLPYRTATAREKVILNVGAIQTRKNIARLVEAFEALDRAVAAGAGRLVRLRRGGDSWRASSGARRATGSRSSATSRRQELAGLVRAGLDLRLPLARRRLRHAGAGGDGGAASRSSPRTARRLPEVAGDAALLVDPSDTGALAGGAAATGGGSGSGTGIGGQGRGEGSGVSMGERRPPTPGTVYQDALGRRA